jgi:hypothetical protein
MCYYLFLIVITLFCELFHCRTLISYIFTSSGNVIPITVTTLKHYITCKTPDMCLYFCTFNFHIY